MHSLGSCNTVRSRQGLDNIHSYTIVSHVVQSQLLPLVTAPIGIQLQCRNGNTMLSCTISSDETLEKILGIKAAIMSVCTSVAIDTLKCCLPSLSFSLSPSHSLSLPLFLSLGWRQTGSYESPRIWRQPDRLCQSPCSGHCSNRCTRRCLWIRGAVRRLRPDQHHGKQQHQRGTA